jgi:hypothetical protein
MSSFEIPDEVVTPFGSTTEVPRVFTMTNQRVPGAATYKDVILLVPEYSAAHDLWFCDLDLDATGTYFPFLSLALARYQPFSLPGVSPMSRVLRADFVQLAPDRWATVSVGAGRIDVTVQGVTPQNALETLRGVASHRVVARLETRLPDAGDLGWTRVDSKPLVSSQSGDLATWTGWLAHQDVVPGNEYRVVLMESEVYMADRVTVDGPTNAERVIYIDIRNV